MRAHSSIAVLVSAAFCALATLARGQTVSDETLESVFRYPRLNRTSPNQGSSQAINMNGNYNYQAAQQVFFITGASLGSNSLSNKGPNGCVTFLERDDYVLKPGIGAYKLHRRKIRWNHARKSCVDEGGNLAILNNAEEERYLADWLRKERVDRAFLGVHDQFEEGDWVTYNGESLDSVGFEKWATEPWPNQPDNADGVQNCGVLNKEGGMDDVQCFHLHPYLCEITLC
ncbi:hemolymph lipopolysaccharide-binding protein [Megalopta genalis]|uniref:hemolymph lipopolysaccharide-binding protein n=1 Tax=Megalopta genalis TaxID=115081 RepID=UPI003FD6217C